MEIIIIGSAIATLWWVAIIVWGDVDLIPRFNNKKIKELENQVWNMNTLVEVLWREKVEGNILSKKIDSLASHLGLEWRSKAVKGWVGFDGHLMETGEEMKNGKEEAVLEYGYEEKEKKGLVFDGFRGGENVLMELEDLDGQKFYTDKPNDLRGKKFKSIHIIETLTPKKSVKRKK